MGTLNLMVEMEIMEQLAEDLEQAVQAARLVQAARPKRPEVSLVVRMARMERLEEMVVRVEFGIIILAELDLMVVLEAMEIALIRQFLLLAELPQLEIQDLAAPGEQLALKLAEQAVALEAMGQLVQRLRRKHCLILRISQYPWLI